MNRKQKVSAVVFAMILALVIAFPPHKGQGSAPGFSGGFLTSMDSRAEWVFRPVIGGEGVVRPSLGVRMQYEHMTGAWFGLMGFTVGAGLLTMVLLKDEHGVGSSQ